MKRERRIESVNHASAFPARAIRLLLLLLVLLAAPALRPALAETAHDITGECTVRFSSSKFKSSMMTDKKYTSHWYTNKTKKPYVEVEAPKDTPIYGFYICFATMPDSYEIQVLVNGRWETWYEGVTDYYHVYYEFPEGADGVRLRVTQDAAFVLDINEIFAFGEGEVPGWVQRWEPTPDQCDLLLVATHPDDELIFFCGAVPTYAVERGNTVAVAYFSYSNTTRRSELLNGLWSMGYRNYPIVGTFRDKSQNKLSDCYKTAGGESAVVGFMTDVIRQTRPQVIVTHDEEGEYGHGQHKMVCDAVKKAFDLAADESYRDGVDTAWQAQKLYLHLYGEPQDYTVVDWDIPLVTNNGQTGRELAIYAFTYHLTQRGTKYDVVNSGAEYDNECFGLYKTLVGADEAKNDFLEHIEPLTRREEAEQVFVPAQARPTARPTAVPDETADPLEIATPVPATPRPASSYDFSEEDISIFDEPGVATPAPTMTPTPEPTPEPTAEPTPEPTATPAPVQEATATDLMGDGGAIVTDIAPPDPAALSMDAHTRLWIDRVPVLNERGFLDEGEFVLADETNGYYIYISKTLRVVIIRHYDGGQNITWFDADILCDLEAGERIRTLFYDDTKREKVRVDAAQNALSHKVVFATNTDYYTYRIGSPRRTGVVIRNGELLIDDPYPKPNTLFPNLDTLAFYPDGRLEVAHSHEHTGKELLASGAENVYSFGPILVRDGVLNPDVMQGVDMTSAQPRYGIGMIEPGHYVAILAEGRLPRSGGVSKYQLAAMLKRRGCVQAINLDGGQTAVMVFMGKQINQIGKYDGKTSARPTCDILAVGTSELVGNVDFQ